MSSFLPPGSPFVSAVTRRAGAVNLAVSGLLNVVVGLALFARGRLTAFLIDTLPEVLGEVTLVSHATHLWTFVQWAPVFGGALLCLGVVQLRFGLHAYHARHWRSSVGIAIAGAINPLAVPATLVAVTLLVISKDKFLQPEHNRWSDSGR